MLNCQSATRLVSEAQERRLSVPEKMGLNVHLMMCSGCMSAEYIKAKNPPEPPCAKYNPQGYTCSCENNLCVVKGKPAVQAEH